MGYSFNRSTLARCFISSDFYDDNRLGDDDYRRRLVEKSLDIADDSLAFNPPILINNESKKTQYTVNDLACKLILRKCAKNIKKYASIKLKPRNKIIKEIKTFLKDGTSCRVYRLDISSFFESCDTENIIKLFYQYGVPTHTVNLMSSFLRWYNSMHACGIPRGIETSPVLAELSLKDFDSKISSNSDVFYFSRYVDDIFIITSGMECEKNFIKTIRTTLPKGLNLNHNKTYISTINNRTIGPGVVSEFEYLGYKISVEDTDLKLLNSRKASSLKVSEYRNVSVDLSLKKQKKMMDKISKSLYSFHKSKDLRLLTDRIVFLSTNRDLLEKNKKRKIPTGIYYSYSEIDCHSNSLQAIDRYFKNSILGVGSRIADILNGDLTKAEIKKLLKISFSNGHKNRVFKKFSPNRLKAISRVWK